MTRRWRVPESHGHDTPLIRTKGGSDSCFVNVNIDCLVCFLLLSLLCLGALHSLKVLLPTGALFCYFGSLMCIFGMKIDEIDNFKRKE